MSRYPTKDNHMPSYWKNKMSPADRDPLYRAVMEAMFQMGDLELRSLKAFSDRILMGQKKFGKLSPLKKHWGKELFEELVDASVYGMVRLIGDPTLSTASAQGQYGAYWDKKEPAREAKKQTKTRQWGWSRKKGAGKLNAKKKLVLAKKGVQVPGAELAREMVKAGTSDANVLAGKRSGKKPPVKASKRHAKASAAKKGSKVAKKSPGRPKGSRNKPKPKPEQVLAVVKKALMEQGMDPDSVITNPEAILNGAKEEPNGSRKNKAGKASSGVENA